MYVVVKDNDSTKTPTDVSVLTRFDEKESFKVLRTISRLPAGKVIEVAIHETPQPIAGLPTWWAVGADLEFRRLPVQPCLFLDRTKSGFESGKGTDSSPAWEPTAPKWSAHEADAAPVVYHPTIGDISVTSAAPLHLWLMTYDSRDPRGIVLRRTPCHGGGGARRRSSSGSPATAETRRIHNPRRDDGLAGPVIGEGKDDPQKVAGGAHAPYVIERFTRVADGRLSLYYVMSTWNPYTVVLMKSEFQVNLRRRENLAVPDRGRRRKGRRRHAATDDFVHPGRDGPHRRVAAICRRHAGTGAERDNDQTGHQGRCPAQGGLQ